LDTQEHEKIEKVTGSQDDGFVGGLEIQLVGYAGARKDPTQNGGTGGAFSRKWPKPLPDFSQMN
jgi:hypothetical protein